MQNPSLQRIQVDTQGQQLLEITQAVGAQLARSGHASGLLTMFIRHTSASLLIQENADPSVQRDLIEWMNRLVPENDPLYTHIAEGPDDMPAHIKCMLTQSSLAVPFEQGRLLLGTWQGLYLFELRRSQHRREVVLHFAS